ncbi:MAG: hypothetical protein FJZ47_23805 [Candidatus Tectomicrobia bacterium]|uniref:Uncharacterized protein n=1 Tax=Tectimicrobiota bacterium TaxID=2528274 RepID=A0A938B4T0_UNCTE|nr:hypothetical protein [Candidatus Tectomicrobia bacterium]
MASVLTSPAHRHQCHRCGGWLHCTATACTTLLILCAACYRQVYGLAPPRRLRRQRRLPPDTPTS